MKTPKIQVYIHFGKGEYQAEEGIPSLFTGRAGEGKAPFVTEPRTVKKIETVTAREIAGGNIRVMVYPTIAQARAYMDGLIVLDYNDSIHVALPKKTRYGWAVLCFDWENQKDGTKDETCAGTVMVSGRSGNEPTESWDIECKAYDAEGEDE